MGRSCTAKAIIPADISKPFSPQRKTSLWNHVSSHPKQPFRFNTLWTDANTNSLLYPNIRTGGRELPLGQREILWTFMNY